MGTIEITEVERIAPEPDQLQGFSIELPVLGSTSDAYSFDFGGWVLGRQSAAVKVELAGNDGSVRVFPVAYPRADVARAYPGTDEALNVGFRAPVCVIGATEKFEFLIQVKLENTQTVPIGRISGRRHPMATAFKPTMQPLLVTSLGRMGTTWMMRLLSEHPSIAALRIHPYETRPGKFWMQQLARTFWREEPFWNDPLSRFGGSGDSWAAKDQQWFCSQLVEQVATSCQRSVEECYREILAARAQQSAAYFAEKHIPDEVPGILWELYSSPREIFLVRDFRDMLCSIRAFNAKRGSVGFNRDQVSNEAEYIQRLGREAQRLLSAWKARKHRAYIVRYEELLARPEQTLQQVLSYVGVDSGTSVVSHILRQALLDTPELKEHRTSDSAGASIGRWRQDLDEWSRQQCSEVFREALTEFGYDKQDS
jgi:sulfotransferase family protein